MHEEMETKMNFTVDTRDRVLRAWENSVQMTRDFKIFAKQIENPCREKELFERFAVDEGEHAAAFLELLQKYEAEKN